MEANRKAQQLFPFIKMAETHGGVPIHLNAAKAWLYAVFVTLINGIIWEIFFFTHELVLINHTCDISQFRRELLIWSPVSRAHSRERKSLNQRFFFSCWFFLRPYFWPNIINGNIPPGKLLLKLKSVWPLTHVNKY